MQSPLSDLVAQPAASPFRHAQRRYYRHPLYSLVYVTLDRENGGILRDLSEDGAAVQAVGALRAGQIVRMRFDLLSAKQTSPRVRVDCVGQVAWANSSGQAGVRFADLTEPMRQQLNQWIFGNLISAIAHASPVLENPRLSEDDHLVLSNGARSPIRVRTSAASDGPTISDDAYLLDWLIARFSPQILSRTVDGLVLSASVLLFFVVALAVAKELPSWPVGLALFAGVGSFFTVLYWRLFRSLNTGTAGQWLTGIAMRELQSERGSEEPEVRFR